MQNINLPKQIETKRLILKPHTLDKDYVQLWVDSVNQNLEWLQRFLPHFDKPVTFEQQKSFLELLISGKIEKNYAIWNKKTGELMGSIGAFNFEENEAEVAILLFKQFSGFGYGTEAIGAFENVLFDAGIKEIVLKIDASNMRSQRIAQKQGYKKTDSDHPDPQFLFYKKVKENPHA